jgi:hypothetical protein
MQLKPQIGDWLQLKPQIGDWLQLKPQIGDWLQLKPQIGDWLQLKPEIKHAFQLKPRIGHGGNLGRCCSPVSWHDRGGGRPAPANRFRTGAEPSPRRGQASRRGTGFSVLGMLADPALFHQTVLPVAAVSGKTLGQARRRLSWTTWGCSERSAARCCCLDLQHSSQNVVGREGRNCGRQAEKAAVATRWTGTRRRLCRRQAT